MIESRHKLKTILASTLSSIGFLLMAQVASAESYEPEALKSGQVDGSLHLQQGSNQTEADQVNDIIFKATGFGNTFMVKTPKGNVIIDTSLERNAPKHKTLLTAVSDGPIHAIILTHGHGDHTGGVPIWREKNTKVIAQENMVEFLHYQKRLEGMFQNRNAAQFGFDLNTDQNKIKSANNYSADILPNTLFDETLKFELGGIEFEVLHTPAETYDALTVWLPQYKAAFVGDLFYQSFPNIYTLRGTKPRWALDYVTSLNRVIDMAPELLLPSHGEPIRGKAEIRRTLEKYRDAIKYVHDQTVLGMNQNKDVYTLMNEIKLPKELYQPESYGLISWSVRGIYEGYMGWFDGKPATMFSQSPARVLTRLVTIAGGAQNIVAATQPLTGPDANREQLIEALNLLNAALAAEPSHKAAKAAKLVVLIRLKQTSVNLNESGWLNYGIRQAKQ